MTSSLDAALIDVRKSYRLLADYQQRIIELLALVRNELNAVDYHYVYRHAPPRGFDGLEHSDASGWRFLPMLDVSVLWRRDSGQEDPVHFHRKGDLLIDVCVSSDSGNGRPGNDVDSPENSESRLDIHFFLCTKNNNERNNWFWKIWKQTDYPSEFNVVEACEGNANYIMYGEMIPLQQLSDETSIRDAIKKLRQRASKKMGYEI